MGFSISGDPTELASGFINGLSVQTMAFASQRPMTEKTHAGVTNGDIILGSQYIGYSAEETSVGDLVYWTKITFSHEGHRFLGYTGELTFNLDCLAIMSTLLK